MFRENMQAAQRSIVETGTGEQTACVSIAGVELLCDWTGCLYWPQERLLVVSDLHFEKGSSFARKGQFLPPYDTSATLALLEAQIGYWKPERIVALGDSFHDMRSAEAVDPQAVLRLQALVARHDWLWITGNHDPEVPGFAGGERCAELGIGALTFRHQPLMGASGEICGHLHPQARLHRRGKTMRRRCFAHDGNRLIMPAFGAYTGGLNIRHQAFCGLFAEEMLSACVLGRNRVYMIAGSNLL